MFITLLGGTSFVVCDTAKFSAELDRVALCALQLLLDLDVASICFVWILSPLEVDPVRKDGVSIMITVDGGFATRFEVTGTTLLQIFVMKFATDTTGLAASSSCERCTPCSTESRGAA